jgi:hypothetical protein
MNIGESNLRTFLVNAKKNTYAISNKNAIPERKDFDELEYSENDFNYRDSYYGFFRAPGQEIVRLKDEPIWSMSYNGGMLTNFQDINFAKKIFLFLKKALSLVEEKNPYRGPEKLEEDDFIYINKVAGSLEDFKGEEKIFYKGEEVFCQKYFGGLIINKEKHFLK